MPEIIIRQIAFGRDGEPANLANGIELPIDNETLDRTMMSGNIHCGACRVYKIFISSLS